MKHYQVYLSWKMWTYNEYGVIGSFLEPLPLISTIESRFDSRKVEIWTSNYALRASIIGSVMYLLLVPGGIYWMSNRKPYGLKKILQLWNIGLAVFSILGTLSLLPNQVHGIMKHGIFHTLCIAQNHYDPHLGLWVHLFMLSKYFEFLDTLFLVLRKKPVSFLHWYHHTTALVYACCVATWSINIGLSFSSMNYAVHSLMYTYYFLRSASVFIPSGVALFITILQISQIFVGLGINVFLYYQVIVLEEACSNITPYTVYLGLIVYGSYAVLFIQYFMGRYVWKAKAKKE